MGHRLTDQTEAEVMRQRNSIYKLSGDIQVGDAYQRAPDNRAAERPTSCLS